MSWGFRGVLSYKYTHFKFDARWASGQRHAPAALPTGKGPDTHSIGVWVGSRHVWTGAENLVSTGIEPRTVQPVASLYTDWVLAANEAGK
jgi:hypothetical protein